MTASSARADATSENGKVRVRVVAGEALGARAAIDTNTPIVYLDFTLEPGADVTFPVAPSGESESP